MLHAKNVQIPPVDLVAPPFTQFMAPNFNWQSVQRIVLLFPANQSNYPKANRELQANLAAEIQRAGRFEVVTAPYDDPGARAQDVFADGMFNELEVLRIAREYQADAVMFANVTQYFAYSPPRIGLSLLIVSPTEGVAIGSVSGLWDSREVNTTKQAQAYFKQNLNWSRSLFAARTSHRIARRFPAVCL